MNRKRTRENKLVKNTIILMIGRACTYGINLLLLPLYTSILSTQEYGTADLVFTYSALIIPFVGLQCDQGLFRFLIDERKKKDNVRQVFNSILVLNSIQIAVLATIASVVYVFIRSVALIYLLIIVSFQVINNSFLQFARGIERTDVYSISGFISALLNLCFNLLFVCVFRLGIDGILLSSILSVLGSLIIVSMLLRLWKYISFKNAKKNMIISVLKYSIPLVPNQLSWWVINTSDRIVVSAYLGTAINGIYAISNKISSIYVEVFNLFCMSWTESVSEAINDGDRMNYINKVFDLFFRVSSSFCLLMMSVIPFIFKVFIDEKYWDAFYQIPILMIAVFFQSIQGMYGAVFVAFKDTKVIAITSIVSAAVNILVDLILIRFIGLYAASISTLVSFVIMTIVRSKYMKRSVEIKLDFKLISCMCFVTVVAFAAYYIELFCISVVSLVIVLMYSVFINRKMFFGLMSHRIIRKG